jgi:hypothetical protein
LGCWLEPFGITRYDTDAVYWATEEVPWALSAIVLEELEAVAQQSLEQALQRVRNAGLKGEALVAGYAMKQTAAELEQYRQGKRDAGAS